MFSKEIYTKRREQLKKCVQSGILVFLGNEDQGLNYADNAFRFRQDSTFLYFFGISDPGLAAIIDIDNDTDTIYGDELTIDHIIWMGNLPTLHERAAKAGINDVRPYNEFARKIEDAIKAGRDIHILPAYRAEHKLKLSDLGLGNTQPSIEFIKGVVNLRNYKSEEEITEIEKACDITADMHIAAIRMIQPGVTEAEVAATIEYIAKKNNAELSFPTIATINGQTLHNHYHGNKVKEGDLFLIDAGAETQMGYAGDMSSTVAATGVFTQRQKEIYEIQNLMHTKSVEALRPGIRFEEVYDISALAMVEAMKEIGLMKGDAQEAVRRNAHALFYPHGLGHMMGLDVHDMENLGEKWVGYDGKDKSTEFGRKSLRLGRELEPGFVHTIEPGIYFIPELIDLWRSQKKFEEFINYDVAETYKDFGGIRNEEDYLITETGARRLGKKIPLTPQEIEECRK